MSVEQKRALIEPAHPPAEIRRRCALLGLARSTLYDQPLGAAPRICSSCDGWTSRHRHPFYRMRRMTAWLRGQGYAVNRKRVARLMRQMGLEALSQTPAEPAGGRTHDLPVSVARRYGRRGSTGVERGYHLYPPPGGVCLLVAVMDWFSRYVLSWALSITLDLSFGVEALEQALGRASPEIFNTDQGAQFTSQAFTARLKAGGIRISMDGRGRALDNVFVERLWRQVEAGGGVFADYKGSGGTARLGPLLCFTTRSDSIRHWAIDHQRRSTR